MFVALLQNRNPHKGDGRENYVVTSIIRLKQGTAGNSRFPATSFLRPSSSNDVVASCSAGLPGLHFLFYVMDSCRTRYRTTSIKDVMEPVRDPTSGFDPEPSTIAEVGAFQWIHGRPSRKMPRYSVIIPALLARRESHTHTESTTRMPSSSAGRSFRLDSSCRMWCA